MKQAKVLVALHHIFVRTFPARNWSLPGYFSKSRFVTKPGEERKTARWERRELKRGPPK